MVILNTFFTVSAFQFCPRTGDRMLISSARCPYEKPGLACSLRVRRQRWTKETCGFVTAMVMWVKCACWAFIPNRRSLHVMAYAMLAYCASPRYRLHNASSKSPISSSLVHCLKQDWYCYDNYFTIFVLNFLLYFSVKPTVPIKTINPVTRRLAYRSKTVPSRQGRTSSWTGNERFVIRVDHPFRSKVIGRYRLCQFYIKVIHR